MDFFHDFLSFGRLPYQGSSGRSSFFVGRGSGKEGGVGGEVVLRWVGGWVGGWVEENEAV